MISMILLVLAFVLFAVAASGWVGERIHRVIAAGLASWVLSVLLARR